MARQDRPPRRRLPFEPRTPTATSSAFLDDPGPIELTLDPALYSIALAASWILVLAMAPAERSSQGVTHNTDTSRGAPVNHKPVALFSALCRSFVHCVPLPLELIKLFWL